MNNRKDGSEAAEIYFRSLSKHEVMTAEEEAETARLIAEGTPDEQKAAREKMINSNLRLVASLAKNYISGNGSLHVMDIIQEGNIGLMDAVERFDRTKGVRFATYAGYWIAQRMMRSKDAQDRMIRLPAYLERSARSLSRYEAMLEQNLGRPATEDELADATGRRTADIKSVRRAANDALSLDATYEIGNEGDVSNLAERVEDESAPDPLQTAYDSIRKEQINSAFSHLTPREREIIRMRFGANGHDMNLEEIGDFFNLTKERIRQIESKAKNKLRIFLPKACREDIKNNEGGTEK